MWWIIGGAAYLLLLTLGLLFLHGAGKLKDPAPPDLNLIDDPMREQDLQENPRQLLLSFTAHRQRALSFRCARLVAAVINKITGIFPHPPGS